MKLNKIEKIIVAVILLGLILVGGTFLFVVPSFEQIDKNSKTLAANLSEKAQLDEKLLRLDTIDADISSKKSDAVKYEGSFYPDLTTYEASEIAMAYLKKAGLEAHAISLQPLTTLPLTLEPFSPLQVTYPLKTYSAAAKQTGDNEDTLLEGEFYDGNKKYTVVVSSLVDVVIRDENGEEVSPSKYTDTMKNVYKAAVCKTVKNGNVNQTVATVQATYSVKGKFSDYVKFIDHIYSLGRATSFASVKYPMTTTIEEDKDSTVLFVGENGTVSTGSEANGKLVMVEDDTEIEEEITLIFMCVEPMESLSTVDADGTSIVVDQRSVIY